MNIQQTMIAKKYAQAFFNVFSQYLHHEDYHALNQAREFFEQHHNFFVLAKIPHIPLSLKKNLIMSVFERYLKAACIEKLVDLIMQEQRLFLLPEIIRQLIRIYHQHAHIMVCTIMSAYQLSEKKIAAIAQFLEHATKKTIEYHYRVDPTLIAGVRAQSYTILWEYSIRQQLDAIQNLVNNKEK